MAGSFCGARHFCTMVYYGILCCAILALNYDGEACVTCQFMVSVSEHGRGSSKKGGGMTVSSTSEWNYPETLAITESDEISELGRFIYDKVTLLASKACISLAYRYRLMVDQ